MIKLINPLLLKINTKNFYSIKVNLLTKTNKIIEHGYHTDFNSDSKNLKVKQLYIILILVTVILNLKMVKKLKVKKINL